MYDDGRRVSEPAVDRPAAIPAALAAAGLAPTAAAGDGALAYAQELAMPVRADLRYPDPTALATTAAERIRGAAPSEPLTPLYLRRPDAVEPGARKPVGS